MDFGETLLAAHKNQQQKTSDNVYYRAKFEPPKKEQKPATKLSANIQKFLAKKEEEERRKQEEIRRKRDELLAMRDPKATRKIQKMLKVIKSANKSVLEEATDHDNTAVTREGAEQPDQDDYGYESQEAAAFYSKMMEKYSKIPEEEKFPTARGKAGKKDLEGTRERMRAALQRGEEPQPRQRKSKAHKATEKEETPPPPPEKRPDKPKIRKAAPPPIDFNQLLKLAEQKKHEPVVVAPPVKRQVEPEPERPMTKRQKKEFEEEQARREARRRRMLEAEGRSVAGLKQEQPRMEKERKSETAFMRIPKLGDKNKTITSISQQIKTNPAKDESRKAEREKLGFNQGVPNFEQKKKVGMNVHNTYRIDKDSNDRQQEKWNRENERSRSSRSDVKVQPNRENERNQGSVLEIRNKPNMQGRTGQSRPENRNRISQEDERGRVTRPEDRSRPNSNDGQSRTNRPENRNRVHSVAEKSQSTNTIDKGRINQESHKSQANRSDSRNREDKRDRPNRPDDRNRANQFDRSQNNKERDTLKNANKGSPNRLEDRLKKENVKANGHRISNQNKVPQKPTSEQLRKSEIREKIMAKERTLFGNNRDSSKFNSGTRPDSNIHVRSNEQRNKETPSKLLKVPSNERRLAPSNNIMKHNQSSNREEKAFDFDKHVNSLKKSGADRSSIPGKKFPPGEMRNKHAPKRRIVDSDSEYDSELDDFIDDDGGEDETNYSEQIKSIFGYDKNRYQDMDDDDTRMESSFAQQMREEYISKKIGYMEDLEDMKQEALEKKRAKKRRRISDDD